MIFFPGILFSSEPLIDVHGCFVRRQQNERIHLPLNKRKRNPRKIKLYNYE